MIEIQMPEVCKGCCGSDAIIRNILPADRWKRCEDGFLRLRYTCLKEAERTCDRLLRWQGEKEEDEES